MVTNPRGQKREKLLARTFDKYIDSTQLLSRGGGLKEIAPVRVLTKTNAVTAIVARLLEKLKPEDKTQENLEQNFCSLLYGDLAVAYATTGQMKTAQNSTIYFNHNGKKQ